MIGKRQRYHVPPSVVAVFSLEQYAWVRAVTVLANTQRRMSNIWLMCRCEGICFDAIVDRNLEIVDVVAGCCGGEESEEVHKRWIDAFEKVRSKFTRSDRMITVKFCRSERLLSAE